MHINCCLIGVKLKFTSIIKVNNKPKIIVFLTSTKHIRDIGDS
jgi:hypothetical protein